METVKKFLTASGKHHKASVDRAPENKGPVRSMPQTACQKDDHDIDVGADPALAVAPQGDINVLGEKTGQGHVPSVPEFGDGQCLVGGVKIQGQVDVKHFSDTDGHVAVAAEVEVDLDGICQHDEKGSDAGELIDGSKAIGHQVAEIIGEQALFRQPKGKEIDTLCQIVVV